MLDGVHPDANRQAGAIEPFTMRSHPLMQAVCLVDHSLHFGALHLRRLRVFEHDGACAGGHDLDVVGATT